MQELLLTELDTGDAGFLHAVCHCPEVSLAGIYLENRQQRIIRGRDAHIFHEWSFLNTSGADFAICNDFGFAADTHNFAEITSVKINFYLRILFQLFIESLDRLALEPETVFVGVPHAQAPYSGLVAFCRGKVAGFVIIGELNAVFKIHIVLLLAIIRL
jgi:NADPH-dependent 7-cyano-7-deazaguanine reductase QueF-like protein